MATPKVSILLMSYNQAPYIEDAYRSALDQSYQHIEIIGFDNGSTDETPQVIRRLAQSDSRIRLALSDINLSVSESFRRALSLVTGKYVSFLYGDDLYLPDKIKLQVECFEKLPSIYGVVYSPGYCLNQLTGKKWIEPSFKESGNVFTKMLLKYHTQGAILPVAPLAKAECYEKIPFRHELFTEGEDILFRFARQYHFQFLDVPLVIMRDHLSNMGKATVLNRNQFLQSMELLYREPNLKTLEKVAIRVYVGRVLRNYGWQGIRLGLDRMWTKDSIKRALMWNPSLCLHPRTMLSLFAIYLPKKILTFANRLMLQLKGGKRNVALKHDYA